MMSGMEQADRDNLEDLTKKLIAASEEIFKSTKRSKGNFLYAAEGSKLYQALLVGGDWLLEGLGVKPDVSRCIVKVDGGVYLYADAESADERRKREIAELRAQVNQAIRDEKYEEASVALNKLRALTR